jgi:hypothetical protein
MDLTYCYARFHGASAFTREDRRTAADPHPHLRDWRERSRRDDPQSREDRPGQDGRG